MAYEGLVNFRWEVVDPCLARCEARIEKRMSEAGFSITGSRAFGSHCYGLEFATSDVDIAVVLAPGENSGRFIETFRERSKASPEFIANKTSHRSDCHQTEFQGLPVDVKPMKGTRASDGAC